jgi:hypothetical protein
MVLTKNKTLKVCAVQQILHAVWTVYMKNICHEYYVI